MSSNDIAYFRRRATDERASALKADRRDVAEIHLELARLYQALVDREDLRKGLPFGTMQLESRSNTAG
jgi:hypothetical protein